MRKIRIVADSSADILMLDAVDFRSAALRMVTADHEFVDDAYLDVGQMVEYFSRCKIASHTACPNTGDYLEAFGNAEEIFCITITSALSGSYNAACAAKKLYESEHPDRRVLVIDSRSAGPELRLAVERMAEEIATGAEYGEICERILNYTRRTGLFFVLKSMKNLANNGRVSKLTAKIAGVVGICVVGKASAEGTLQAMSKCRGETRALECIVEQLRSEGYRGGRVRIDHCFNESGAITLKEMIERSFAGAEVAINPCRGLCSFYAEVGGLLVGFEK